MSTGAIHDLGYKRYAGTRQDAGTRWRVIMRHQVSMAWKTWWRFKAWLGMAVLVSVIAGAFTYSTSIFKNMGHVSDVALMMRDAALPLAISWYCRVAFIASLTLTATIIAGDLQSGAFTFYFARSVRPRDYVAGKLAGIASLMAILTMIGPVLLAGFRLGLSESSSDLINHLVVLPEALAIGALTTVSFTAVPLAFSALAESRRTALAMWAAYYLVGGTIAIMIGSISKTGWIAALDLPTAVQGVANRLFGVPLFGARLSGITMAEGLTSIVLQVGIATAIVWVTVDRAQKSGIGGAT